MQISMFGVSTVELCCRYASNGNCRRIRITAQHYNKDELVPDILEITLYGNTDSLEALPHSSDFVDHDPKPEPSAMWDDGEGTKPVPVPWEEENEAPVLTDEQLAEIDAEAETQVQSDTPVVARDMSKTIRSLDDINF